MAAQVSKSCGLPWFISCMLPRSFCWGHVVLGLPLGISFYLMPCVGPRSFHPMSFFSLVQSRWSSHQFLVGSSDIYSPGSICAGTSLSGPFIMFPWVHISLWKHRNDSPLDETWPQFSVEFAFVASPYVFFFIGSIQVEFPSISCRIIWYLFSWIDLCRNFPVWSVYNVSLGSYIVMKTSQRFSSGRNLASLLSWVCFW